MRAAPRKRLLLAAGRGVFLVAALGFLGWKIGKDADGAADALHRIGLGHGLFALVAALVGLAASGLAWRAVLAGLGSRLPVPAVPPVFFVAQIGKYLPGAVWPYLAQVRLGRNYGVPASRSAAASALFVLAHCATGGAIAAAVLPWASPDAVRRFWWALALAPLMLLFLHPRVMLPLLRLAHRLARRGTAPERMDGRQIGVAFGWMAVTWFWYGASMFALLQPLTSGGLARRAAISLGGYALGWTVGFCAAAVLVAVAPAGLGFREVTLLAVLTPVLTGGPAAAVVLVSRVVQTVGDALWAIAGLVVGRRTRPRVADAEPAPTTSFDPTPTP